MNFQSKTKEKKTKLNYERSLQKIEMIKKYIIFKQVN